MKIIDKAAWQIDGGVPEDKVVRHFTAVFEWLSRHGMLTEEGEDELEDGIDDCASLNDELVSGQGIAFLESCYDDYLRAVKNCYGDDEGCEKLESIWQKYIQTT